MKSSTIRRPDPLSEALARLDSGSMDIHNMLAELRADKAALEDLILAAERYASRGGRRRGRPPKWMSEAKGKRRGRPPGSKNKTAAATA